MAIKDVKLYGTTNSGGALTVTGQGAVSGFLYAIEWIDGSFADGVDAVISCTNTPSGVDNTLLTLTNANDDAWYFVRETEDDNTGAAGTSKVLPILNGVPKLVVSSGGDTKAGGCVLYYMD